MGANVLRISELLVAVLLVSACALDPPIYSYRDTNQCGITNFNQAWAEGNVSSMTWTGPCVAGLADGVGRLTIRKKDGTVEQEYEGRMKEGRYWTGPGETARRVRGNELRIGSFDGVRQTSGQEWVDGVLRFEGQFRLFGDFGYYSGKSYRQDGSLWREGEYAENGYLKSGKFYWQDGDYVEGDFDVAAKSISWNTGAGVLRGVERWKDGSPYRWIERGKLYENENLWRAAILATQEAERAAEQARLLKEKKEKEAREEVERQQTQQQISAVLGLLGTVMGEVAEREQNKADQRLRQQVADQQARDAAANSGSSETKLLKDWSPVTTSAINETPYLQVCIRDHECEDGDILRVSVNGSVTAQSELFNASQCENTEVRAGVNTVQILAVNGTGYKGNCDFTPINTGEISVSGFNRDGSTRPRQTQTWKLQAGAGSVTSVDIVVE